MRMLTRVLLPVLALAVAAGAAQAQSGERNTLRAHVFWADPQGSGPHGVDPEAAFGVDAAWEWRWGQRLGFDLGIAFSTHDLERTGEEVDPTPIIGSVLFHVTPDADLNVYVGPSLAVVLYDDIAGHNVDTDLAVGFKAGIDVPLRREGLALSFEVRYLRTSADVSGFGAIDVDPLSVGAGIAYRF